MHRSERFASEGYLVVAIKSERKNVSVFNTLLSCKPCFAYSQGFIDAVMWLRRCPVTVTGRDWRIPCVGRPTRWCTAQQWNKALWDVEEFATPSKILLDIFVLLCYQCKISALFLLRCEWILVWGWWVRQSSDPRTLWHWIKRERKDYSITMRIQFFV